MNAEEREMYELRIKAIRDEMNIRESGYEDGEKAGKAKGRIEGIAISEAKGRILGKTEGIAVGKNERSIEIAKTMLKENASIEFIAKVTGLTQKEIEKLK